MSTSLLGSHLGSSYNRSFGEVGPAVAPEHVLRLLQALDEDRDDLIRVEDLLRFTKLHNLPLEQSTLYGMFNEANYTRDGLIDLDQLAKGGAAKKRRW